MPHILLNLSEASLLTEIIQAIINFGYPLTKLQSINPAEQALEKFIFINLKMNTWNDKW